MEKRKKSGMQKKKKKDDDRERRKKSRLEKRWKKWCTEPKKQREKGCEQGNSRQTEKNKKA